MAGDGSRGERETGPAVVPGDPAASRMVQLISLPADDLDIMPAKGDPLTADQWRALYSEDTLTRETRRLMESLGLDDR